MVDATRDMILDCDDIELVKLTVPAWKDKEGNALDVYIKQMSGQDAEEYTKAMEDSAARNVKAIVTSVCTKDGARMFKREDIDKLLAKNSRVLQWLVEEIIRINFAALDDVETIAKN